MKFRDVQRAASDLQAPLDDAELAALCRHLLGEQTPLLHQEHVRSGRFNTTHRLYFAGRPPLILRLAPPPGAQLFRHEAALLQHECAIQPLLATVGAVIPKVLAADFSRALLPRAFVLQNCLEGVLWDEVAASLNSDETASLWRQLGFYVRRIHGITSQHFGFPAPLGSHQHYSNWLSTLVDGMAQDFDELGLAIDGMDMFRKLLTRGAALIDQVGAPCLVHGDLWPRNILVTRRAGEWVISGVLDAERAFWGEPAGEWIFSFLDIPEDFWRAYGDCLAAHALDRAALYRRRCYEARGALQLILEAQRYGFDAGFARQDFAASVSRMEQLLCSDARLLADAV